MTATLRSLSATTALATCVACAPVYNYLDPAGPLFQTSGGSPREEAQATLRVVTFNIEKGLRLDLAIAALTTHPDLARADVLALQEMDASGTARVAQALAMNSVYYPASREPTDGTDWGNAILSPWPIEEPRKLLLPHRSRMTRRARIATAARVRLPGGPVQVYSIHLGSPLGMSEGRRRDQAAVVLADARSSDGPVIVLGDFNSHGIGRLFQKDGYCWPTERVGPTTRRFSFDHVFLRHLCTGDGVPAGVAREVKDASDHRPVWAVVPAH